MIKRFRTLLAVLSIAALLVTAVAFRPVSTSAANLTGGNYTYLVNGEEMTFTFDPVVRKDGVLLPLEVFQQFGITMDGGQLSTFMLSKEAVVAKLTVGTTTVVLNGNAQSVSTAPVRLNGRIFIPSDLLKEFGVDFAQDGNYISLRSFVGTMPRTQSLTDSEFNALQNRVGILNQSLKADSGSYLNADFLLLNADLVNTTNLGLSFGVRARLLSMLETNTLVYVRLSNLSNKAGALVTASTYLVDNLRNQYDVLNVMDLGSGLLTNKVVPGATRTGVLVYGKVPGTAELLSVYYDPNGTSLRTFPYFK
jgi:hypothetical protein